MATIQDIETFRQTIAEVKELQEKVEAYEVAIKADSLHVAVGHSGIAYQSRHEIYEIYGLLSFKLKEAQDRLSDASAKALAKEWNAAVRTNKRTNATIIRNRLEVIAEQIVAGDSQKAIYRFMRAYSDIWDLETALMEEEKTAATPPSENAPRGAAEKMPGGGSGNFDREGGLDFSDLYPIRNPEYESGALTGNIDNFMPWHVAVDDTTFHAEITIPVKVFFCQNVSDVADEDPDISVGVAYKASGGHLYVAATYESGEFLSALDDVLVKAEKLQALPEYQTAYEHWKTRAKAYRRGVVDARRAA
jgi:hypothetical protein